MSVQPPEEWVKGRHGDHDVVVVEVAIRRDAHGRVYSAHRLQDEADRDVALSWPSGGLEQVAFALLVEAVRREAVLDVALKASHDAGFIGRWNSASEAEKVQAVAELSAALRATVSRTVARVAEAALVDAVAQFDPSRG